MRTSRLVGAVAVPGQCSLDVIGVSGPEQTGKQRPGIAVRVLQECGERHRRVAAHWSSRNTWDCSLSGGGFCVVDILAD